MEDNIKTAPVLTVGHNSDNGDLLLITESFVDPDVVKGFVCEDYYVKDVTHIMRNPVELVTVFKDIVNKFRTDSMCEHNDGQSIMKVVHCNNCNRSFIIYIPNKQDDDAAIKAVCPHCNTDINVHVGTVRNIGDGSVLWSEEDFNNVQNND